MPFDSFAIANKSNRLIDASQILCACLYGCHVPIELRKIIKEYLGFPLLYYYLKAMIKKYPPLDIRIHKLQRFEIRKFAHLFFSKYKCYYEMIEVPESQEELQYCAYNMGFQFKNKILDWKTGVTMIKLELPAGSLRVDPREFERHLLSYLNMPLYIEGENPIEPKDIAKEITDDDGFTMKFCHGGCMKHHYEVDMYKSVLFRTNRYMCQACMDKEDLYLGL
jgi:hypothetical protein